MKLNDQQEVAVRHRDGPLLVLAGAGAGKTRIVTARIAELVEEGVPPHQILAVTFTNKAAQEMQHRVERLCSARVLVSTFHSLGARILRESIDVLGYQSNFVIYDEEDTGKVIRTVMKELNIKALKPKTFRHLISAAKGDLLGPEEVEIDPYGTDVEKLFPEVYKRYQAILRESNALDFDDLLYLTVKLFETDALAAYQRRWRYLLIDEYQDTNHAQYLIAQRLVANHQNLFVVGDPDQSIYSWRGANIDNILNFEKDYPGAKVVRLEQNYRSTNTILEAANALIQENVGRYEKNLWSELGSGDAIREKRCSSDWEEAEFIADRIDDYHCNEDVPLSEMVVFYRTNAQSRQLEDALLRKALPYVIVGGTSFYQRREVKDILALLRMVENGTDFIALARTINLPKRGIGAATLEKIRAASQGQSLIETCRTMKFSAKQRAGVDDYIALIDSLKEIDSLPNLVEGAISQSGYLAVLKEEPESFQDRKANLDALIAKAVESEELTLSTFLEELALKSSLDEASTDSERVSLMTLHNGKGLEFTVAFVAGLEEGLFPHINSIDSPEAIEEERRLCYVGMTRAKRHLYLTSSASRFLWGGSQHMRPSRFLREIPDEYKQRLSASADSFSSWN